jgi:hypothetical protein
MFTRMRVCPLVLLVVPFFACGGSGSPAGATAHVRDSAGITIVENTDPLWDAQHAWSVSESPTLTIGVIEGDAAYELYRTVGATRLSDGRIVLATSGTHELRFYDAAGTHLRSVGRGGGGPGEFRMMGTLDRIVGDTLVVYDLMQRRVSIFDADGAHVSDVNFAVGGQFVLPVVLGRLADGSYLAQLSFRQIGPNAPQPEPGDKRDSVIALRIGPNGDTFDTVGVYPSSVTRVQMLTLGGASAPFSLPVLFSPQCIMIAGRDGIIAGTSDAYDVRFYTPGGTLQRIVRKSHVPLAVTPVDVDSMEAQTSQAIARANVLPAEIRSMFDDRPAAETMPAFRALTTDSEDNLWVEEYRRPGDDVPRWSVFDPEGRFLGVVTGPAGVSVMDIGADYLLGRVTDDMDVERVVMYALVKP